MTITSNTIIKLTFRERLRVLFGRTIHVETRIETAQETEVLASPNAFTWVETIFPRKRIGAIELRPQIEPTKPVKLPWYRPTNLMFMALVLVDVVAFYYLEPTLGNGIIEMYLLGVTFVSLMARQQPKAP